MPLHRRQPESVAIEMVGLSEIVHEQPHSVELEAGRSKTGHGPRTRSEPLTDSLAGSWVWVFEPVEIGRCGRPGDSPLRRSPSGGARTVEGDADRAGRASAKVMSRHSFRPRMTNSCPDCGSSIEYEEHEARLRTGTCSSCSREFAIVEGSSVASRLGAPRASSESEGERSGGEGVEGLECDACGGPLTIRPKGQNSLELTCEDCDTTTVFVPAPATARSGSGRPGRFDSGTSRSRPCRQCGAPLRFSTDDDGNLVGECDACGNRFTLPPRDRAKGPRGEGRYGRGSYRGSGREGGSGRRFRKENQNRPYRGGSGPRGGRYETDPRRARRRRGND